MKVIALVVLAIGFPLRSPISSTGAGFAPAGDTVRFRFGWRPGSRVAVQLKDLRPTGAGVTDSSVVEFEMETSSDSLGLRIDYRGFDATVLAAAMRERIRGGMDPRGIRTGVEAGVAFRAPSTLVRLSGEFLAFDLGPTIQALTEEASDRWGAAFADTVALFLAAILSGASPEFPTPEVIHSKVQRRWRDAVEDWAGQTFEVGVPLESQSEVPVNGRGVGPLRRSFLVESAMPCPAPRAAHRCVVAQVTTEAAPEASSDFRAALLAEHGIDPGAPWSVGRQLRVQTGMIVESESLLPHRVDVAYQVETPAGDWVDWGREVWLYTYSEGP